MTLLKAVSASEVFPNCCAHFPTQKICLGLSELIAIAVPHCQAAAKFLLLAAF